MNNLWKLLGQQVTDTTDATGYRYETIRQRTWWDASNPDGITEERVRVYKDGTVTDARVRYCPTDTYLATMAADSGRGLMASRAATACQHCRDMIQRTFRDMDKGMNRIGRGRWGGGEKCKILRYEGRLLTERQ